MNSTSTGSSSEHKSKNQETKNPNTDKKPVLNHISLKSLTNFKKTFRLKGLAFKTKVTKRGNEKEGVYYSKVVKAGNDNFAFHINHTNFECSFTKYTLQNKAEQNRIYQLPLIWIHSKTTKQVEYRYEKSTEDLQILDFMDNPRMIIMPLINALIECESLNRVLYGISLNLPIIKTEEGQLKIIFSHFLTESGADIPFSLTSMYPYIAFPTKSKKLFLEDQSGPWLVGMMWMLLASKEPHLNMESVLKDPNKCLRELKLKGRLNIKLASLIDKMVRKDPKDRLTLNQVKGLLLHHNYVPKDTKRTPTNRSSTNTPRNSISRNKDYSIVKQSERVKIEA